MAASASAADGPSPAALTAWLDAARDGLWAPLSDMLASARVTVDARDEHGSSALLVCCEEGHEDCVQELLKAGARLDQADESGSTGLMLAADAGAVGCVRQLLQAAEDLPEDEVGVLPLNAQDEAGDTAAMRACRAGELGVLQALVEYEEQRCDLEITNKAGDNALIIAVANTPASSAADADADAHSASASASESSSPVPPSLALLHFLLTNPRSHSRPNGVNKLTGAPALHEAVRGEKRAVVRLLLQHGADVNKQDYAGTTAVMLCVTEELPLPLLSLLLAHSPNLALSNSRGYTALHLAVRDNLPQFVAALLKADASAGAGHAASRVLDGEFGWTPLMHAAAKGQTELVKAMGEAGVDVNVPDKRGSTALMLSCRFGHLSAVKYLVKFQSALRARDHSGHTALGDAAAAGQVEIVRFLLGKGAPLDVTDNRGNNLLHQVAEKQQLHPRAVEIVTGIMEGFAEGKAASASSSSSSEIPPADPLLPSSLLHALNADAETPWTLARSRKHSSLTSLFARIGASHPPPAPELTSVVSGDGQVSVGFKPHPNAAFMGAEISYEATATPVLLGAERKGKEKKSGSDEKEEKKPTTAKKVAPGTIAEPVKKSSSIKKVAGTSSSSVKKPAASSASSASTSAPKREVVTALPTPQSARGSFSPLRIPNLMNGVRYVVSIVALNAAGPSVPTSQSGDAGVVVGTPSAPLITQVVTGANWASVSFMPGGGGGGVGGGSGGETDRGSMAATSDASNTPAAVQEFILTATVSTPNPRLSAPASSLASISTSSQGVVSSNTHHRVVSAVSSPILLTNLSPGLSYALSIRARNGFGEGSSTAQKIVTIGAAAASQAQGQGQGQAGFGSSLGGSSNSASGRPGSAMPVRAVDASVAGEKHLVWLSPATDASDLAECQSLLLSALSTELQGLLKHSHAANPSAPHPHPHPHSGELLIRRAAKISNPALQSAFDAAPAFMQALGASRAEATRTQWGFVALEHGQRRGDAQLATVATHGLLPHSHPLHAASSFAAASAAAASTAAADSGSPSYNQNMYPVGSPFRGVYVDLHVGRRMLHTAAEGAESDVHRVVISRVLPGRTRSTAVQPAMGTVPTVIPSARPASARSRPASAAIGGRATTPVTASPAVTAGTDLPPYAQSTSFDSHQSPSGSSLFLYSPSQLLPVYCVEFVLPLTAAPTAAPLSEVEATLERDAAEQGGAVSGEAAPVRVDPLGADRMAGAFGAGSRWMGGAPGSAADPPGDVSRAELAARDAASAGDAAAPASAAAAYRGADQDDEAPTRSGRGQEEREERLDISTAQSSLLGPKQPPGAKPRTTAAAAASRR